MAIKLAALKRDDYRHAVTKEIRDRGFIPAVVYGKDKPSQTVQVDSVELLKTVRDEGRNAIISLEVENGDTLDVMLHEYQRNPIKDELIHADFYIVDMSEEMDVEVYINVVGEAPGTKEGGILQQPMHALQVRAKPRDIPEEIVVDVAELAIGDSISVADIKESNKFEILDDPDTTLVSVLPPEEEEEEEEGAAEAGLEPELVDAEEEQE